MTLILAAEFPSNRFMLAFTLPTYRPSILAGVIAALLLALGGLLVDVVLSQPVGTVSLWLATVAAGIVLGLIPLEVMRQ